METIADAPSTRRLFEDLIGNPQLSFVDRDIAGKFRSLILSLPPKYAQAKPWYKMAPLEVIAITKDDKSIQRITPKTADKHFNFFEQYWSYLLKSGKVGKSADNPFLGFRGKRKNGRKARSERLIWSDEQTQKLFASPLFTGCLSIHRRSTPGNLIIRDARFWVTVMGLLIGARENEICARKVGDITFAQLPNGNGIPTPVLSITGSKTEGSERDIPLPEALLRLGFLEYRVLGRDAEDPLFPELLPDPQTGKRAPAFSGWFTRYR